MTPDVPISGNSPAPNYGKKWIRPNGDAVGALSDVSQQRYREIEAGTRQRTPFVDDDIPLTPDEITTERTSNPNGAVAKTFAKYNGGTVEAVAGAAPAATDAGIGDGPQEPGIVDGPSRQSDPDASAAGDPNISPEQEAIERFDTEAEALALSPTTPTAIPEEESGEAILSARGTFYRVELMGRQHAGPGFYAVDDLNHATGHKALGDVLTPNSPILITGVEMSQNDIISAVPCLDNVKVFYVFGQNFGTVVITGEILIGPLGDPSTDGVRRLQQFFWANRSSKKFSTIGVSVMKQEAYPIFLTGMKIGAIDPNFHVMPFALFGTLLDISRDNPSKVNPDSTIITSGNIGDPALFRALSVDTQTEASTSSSDQLDSNVVRERFDGELSLAGAPASAGAVLAQKTAAEIPKTPEENSYAQAQERFKRDIDTRASQAIIDANTTGQNRPPTTLNGQIVRENGGTPSPTVQWRSTPQVAPPVVPKPTPPATSQAVRDVIDAKPKPTEPFDYNDHRAVF